MRSVDYKWGDVFLAMFLDFIILMVTRAVFIFFNSMDADLVAEITFILSLCLFIHFSLWITYGGVKIKNRYHCLVVRRYDAKAKLVLKMWWFLKIFLLHILFVFLFVEIVRSWTWLGIFTTVGLDWYWIPIYALCTSVVDIAGLIDSYWEGLRKEFG